jgi:hypothetical protein
LERFLSGSFKSSEVLTKRLRGKLAVVLEQIGSPGGPRKLQAITDRFAGFQAQCLNGHVDFPLVQRVALPVTIGSVRYPGIRIQTRG